MNFAQYVFSSPYFGWLCQGVLFTIMISVITGVCSLILGLVVCSFRISSRRVLRLFGMAYVALFRNIPPLPLLLLLVFGFPGLYAAVMGRALSWDTSFPFLILGLSLNTSAYVADIFRSGVQGIPAGQVDAGRVLGLSRQMIRAKIIIPQALRIAFPALSSRLIHNLKNSAVALVLPLQTTQMELMGQVGRVAGQTFAWAEPIFFAAVVYVGLSLGLTWILRKLAGMIHTQPEQIG